MSVLDRRSYVSSESRPQLSLAGSMQPARPAVTQVVEAPRQVLAACGVQWPVTMRDGQAGIIAWSMEQDGSSRVAVTSVDGSQLWLSGHGAASQRMIDGVLHVQASALTDRGEVGLTCVLESPSMRVMYAATSAGDVLGVRGGCYGQPEQAAMIAGD
jgi:hypothetical protein